MGARGGWSRLVPPVVVLAVLSPLLLTGRSYDPDWFNHLWLVLDQHDAIARGGLPTLFTHTDGLGTFYPQFAFYGGTLYGLAGYLSFPLGDSPTWGYVAFFAIAFAMAYGGWSWLARQAGLRGWPAHVPGLVHVTAAYVLTNAYARGTWPELVATSAIPVVIAGGWWLLRAPRWRAGPVAAWVAGVVLMTGSHNITLVWGAVFVALVALAAAFALGPALRALDPRRVAAVLALGATAVAVNAWFLLPDLAYSSRVGVDAYATGAPQFNTLGQVFSPLRPVPHGSSTPGLSVQMPVLALGWALLAGLLCGLPAARRRLGGWARLAVGLAVLLVGFLILVLRDDPTLDHVGAPGRGAWRHLPHFLTYVQFAYRLETYVTLLVCGLLLLALVAVARSDDAARRRRLHAVLGAIALWSVGLAVWQVWSVPDRGPGRGAAAHLSSLRLPSTWEDPGSFQDRSGRVVPGTEVVTGPTPREAAEGRSFAVPPAGEPVATTITGGPYLVDVDLPVVGRKRAHRLVVLAPGAAQRVRATRASSAPVVVGRWLTVAGLAGLMALALTGLARRRRRRDQRVSA
jgi:hypothetical protein